MEGNFVNKFINRFKNKLNSNKNNYPHNFEYVFSDEDVNKLAKQNKEKIDNLKRRSIGKDKVKEIDKLEEENILNNINNELFSKDSKNGLSSNNKVSDVLDKTVCKEKESVVCESNKIDDENIENDKIDNENIEDENKKNSYSDPGEDMQLMIKREIIKLDLKELDKYIARGRDILNHNYSITYGDDALRYIYVIRDKYSALIEYLIGFNNEKRGIYNKSIFSNRLDDEWRYLKNYVSVLEMIKNLKK